MKQFTRLFSLVLTVVFAVSLMQAQNTVMTKAQKMGLKSSSTHMSVPKATTTASRDILLEEGFDTDWLPTGWTVINYHPTENWEQSNVTDQNFDQIDPNSLYSAICPWVAEDQDEWLITPTIDAMGETPLTLEFWAGVSGPWLNGATLICNISTDGGTTWTPLWNALYEIDPAADWAWNDITINLNDYAGTPFQIAWQYVGNDGDVVGVDGVEIRTGYNYDYWGNFDDLTVGEYLALNDQTGYWSTWSGAPGTAEDAFIDDTYSYSPSNSVKVEGSSTDLLFLMGDKTSGVYHAEIKYYVQSGYGGYINIQHFESPGIEWAHEVYFGAEAIAGHTENGFMYAGSPDSLFFSFPYDTWFMMEWEIDLDNDWIQFYIDGTMIHEWQFSLQAQGDAGTNQLGAFDIYAGAPTGDEVHYWFDDLGFATVQAGSVSPTIDTDASAMFVNLEEGQTTTETFSIGNTGEEDLNFENVVTYPAPAKALNQTPAGVNPNVNKNLNRMVAADPDVVVGKPAPADRDEVLQYDDGVYFTAIGNNSADYEWRVAAKFPADMLAPYIGMNLYQVSVYCNDPPLGSKIQVYGMGNYITGQPGDLIAEQDFTANVQDWTDVTLDTPIYIDGQDLWVGYWVQGQMGTFVPGCDAGPGDPNGKWIAFGPGWGLLDDGNPDLNYNWLIHAHLNGDPIVQWLSTDPSSGTLAQDEYTDVDVTIDATNLVSDTYTGKVIIRNNDPENPEVKFTVICNVTVGINENGEKEYVSIYPNPASDFINIGSNGAIQHVTMMNNIGQVVLDQEMDAAKTQLNTSNLQSGIYFIHIDTKNGTTTQKIVIE